MEKKMKLLIVVLIVILVIAGFFIYKGISGNVVNEKDDPRKMNVTIQGTPIVNPDDIVIGEQIGDG